MRFFSRTLGLAALGLVAATLGARAEDGLQAKGAYLATAADCAACHTAPGGKSFAGGLGISSPVGTIFASNITPSKTAGIGDYSEHDFARALREGIRKDGANLYPAMPYTSYAKLTDADVKALYAYFMQDVQPVDVAAPTTHLPFPMNIRMSMKVWNLLFLNDTPFTPVAGQSAEWNRGAYLAEGAAHCSTCHTPRGFLMQEKTGAALSGAAVGAWYAPNITSDPATGIGRWSTAELTQYLKTGHLPQAQAAGSMAEAVTHSFSHLSDADLQAIATYVKSVPAVSAPTGGSSRFDKGGPGDAQAAFRGKGYAAGIAANEGAQLYSGNCASCHGAEGQGTKDGYYPRLFDNSATGGPEATNLIATILNGVDRETPQGHVFMPPFGDQTNAVMRLDDAQVAQLANYVLHTYGNGALSVTPEQVAQVRAGGAPSNLVLLARIGIAVGAVIALLILIGLILGLRRRAARG